MLRLAKCLVFSLPIVLLSACVLAPGMRVGQLPDSGTVVVESGLKIQVDQVTANNLPKIQTHNYPSSILSLFVKKPMPIYLLAPGDVLSINLWANPEITPPVASSASGILGGFVIDQHGYVSFPLIGRIKAAGESVDVFSTKLRSRLSLYLKQPDAQVKVLLYAGQKFNIDGAVKIPGQYAISDQPQSIYGALTRAGGVSDNGDLGNILFTRDGHNYDLNLLDLQRDHIPVNNLLLKEGDNVHVYSVDNRKLYILGESGIPTALNIPEQGMSLANVIGEGRGLNPLSSNPAMVYVVRDNLQHDLTHIYHINLSSIANLALADRFKMQPNDIVYVDAAGLARWNRVLSLLLPSAQGLSSLGTASYYAKQD